MYSQSVPALISKNVGNTLRNYRAWNSVMYNVLSYGAIGDGAADDSASIQDAIDYANSQGGGIVFVPPGTFLVSQTIIVKQNVEFVMTKGTIIKCLTNVNVFQIKPESTFNGGGGVVTVIGATGYTSTLIFLDGADKFGEVLRTGGYVREAWSNTYIKDVTLQADTYLGSGIKLYCNNSNVLNQYIEFVQFSNIQIIGFNKAVWLQCDTHASEVSFINGNMFDSITVVGSVYGFYLEGSTIPYEVNGNYFTNFQFQTFYFHTVRAIYCNARFNVFQGFVWDYVTDNSPAVAFEIGTGGVSNVIETDMQLINSNLTLDKGYNTIVKGQYDQFFNINSPSILNGRIINGDQDDFLTLADRRYTVTSTPAVTSGSYQNMFNPNGSYVGSWNNTIPSATIVIDMTSSPIGNMQFIGVAFSNNQIAKHVKFEYDIGAGYVTAYETLINYKTYVVYASETYIQSVKKLRITFSDPTVSSITVGRIFAQDSSQFGRTWMSVLGGSVYGDLTFPSYVQGPVLTSPDGSKYRIYANNGGTLGTSLVP